MEHVDVLGIILAGGKGERLYPLTTQRSKPAVPFAGKYRIVDFVLSNFINSGIYSIYVLTQFKSQSLLQHLHDGWQFSDLLKNQFIIPVPAQMRKGEKWYEGTSDAIFQNIHLLELARPELVAVFGADHIYRMDISQMVAYHRRKGAEGEIGQVLIVIASWLVLYLISFLGARLTKINRYIVAGVCASTGLYWAIERGNNILTNI